MEIRLQRRAPVINPPCAAISLAKTARSQVCITKDQVQKVLLTNRTPGSCSNDQTIICGNILDLSGLGIGKRNDGGDGDKTSTSCSGNQSTMCCDKSGKDCSVKDSCSNTQTIFCGNTISIPVTTDLGSILRRTDDKGNNGNGDNTNTKCSGNQSTMCCDNSGKNCSVKGKI